MKLEIDNFDGGGLLDYTSAMDGEHLPKILRRLNRPSELAFGLVAAGPDFLVPSNGARVKLEKTSGLLFTGYLREAPVYEYLGWGQSGPVYRYNLVAESDEVILDRKQLPSRPAFVERRSGDALRQLTDDLIPGGFDTSNVQDLDDVPWYFADPQTRWSSHAAELALRARASYRTMDGAVILAPVGATTHSVDESADEFSPEGLKVTPLDRTLNDVTVIGRLEPRAYVKDYFVADGLSLKFYLSQIPFTRRNRTVIEDEYKGPGLDATRWKATDPLNVVTVSGGKLQIAGGTGTDGGTTVVFSEKIEMGGAYVLQHGDVSFTAASNGVFGGLYPAGISIGGCLAGFRITPNGTQSDIQALVNGAVTGPVITTAAGHRYLFSTRFYAGEIYRKQQIFHSSAHPAGSGRGGADIAASVRVLLEVHDVDTADPASLVAPATVLFEGVISDAPGFCTYGLMNAASLHCSVAFTRLTQAVDAEVRSAPPLEDYSTRLVGSLSDGAECLITSEPALQFFPQYLPVEGELIEVHYRGRGRAMGRVMNPASIAALAMGSDDGLRGAIRTVKAPVPRTAADCENAALAVLDEAPGTAWTGEYSNWSRFLPGGADIFPGDGIDVNSPSREAAFPATVREVAVEVKDLAEELCTYRVRFADDAAEPLAFEFDSGGAAGDLDVSAVNIADVSTAFLPDLTAAAITAWSSTTATLDAGVAPPSGGGIEVRRSDFGWSLDNDRNLVGHFSTQGFTVPRLARLQDYFLRQYDASAPPKYSRYSAALHLDYPL